MYDSKYLVKETALRILCKRYDLIVGHTKIGAEPIFYQELIKERSRFIDPDQVTAGTMILLLIDDGYLENKEIKNKGYALFLTEKGKEYIKQKRSN